MHPLTLPSHAVRARSPTPCPRSPLRAGPLPSPRPPSWVLDRTITAVPCAPCAPRPADSSEFLPISLGVLGCMVIHSCNPACDAVVLEHVSCTSNLNLGVWRSSV
ncbi:hypothetical protein OH77DRAFT_233786 [Trametes cingulata]|nr:hypothetical protein OH77DRAFT_233786 [Trametes cingulata]